MTATFLSPNPMHPNVRFMGFETTRKVKSAEEAKNIALTQNMELLCVKK